MRSELRQSKRFCHLSCRISPFPADLLNCGFLTEVRNDTGNKCHPEEFTTRDLQ